MIITRSHSRFRSDHVELDLYFYLYASYWNRSHDVVFFYVAYDKFDDKRHDDTFSV